MQAVECVGNGRSGGNRPSFMMGCHGDIIWLGQGSNAAGACDTLPADIGPHYVDEALAQQLLESTRISNGSAEPQWHHRLFADFTNGLKISDRARLVEP